jgi:lipoprotein-anchoring transpeptidase ErfK/SrfK
MRFRTQLRNGLLAVLAGGAAVAVATIPWPAQHHAKPPSAASAAARHAVRPATLAVLPGWTMIVTLARAVPGYARPGGRRTGTVAASWYERPLALPVIGQQPGWVRVRLPTRPNGSTAWLRTAPLSFTATPYRIVVNLATRHLKVLRAGHVVMNAPAGIGTGSDPTPAGQFFVAFREQSPSPGYGPFILVTSAHSDTIADWQRSGDSVIGIHGPLGAPIGAGGAAVSHGCIRIPVRDLVRLARLPAGTPITIIT